MNAGDSLLSSSAGTMAVVALILALLALVGVVIMLARQQRLLGQYQHLMMGTSGGNLESMLNEHIAQVRATADRVESVDQLARRLEKAAYFSLQHLGVVRFRREGMNTIESQLLQHRHQPGYIAGCVYHQVLFVCLGRDKKAFHTVHVKIPVEVRIDHRPGLMG